jgi:malonyl-CoA O-methyltransferase
MKKANILEKQVAENFSRSALSYGDAANFQRYAAGKICSLLPEKNKKDINIFEIGCGTGFLTLALLERYPEARLTVCDISKEMLDICRKNIEMKLGKTKSAKVNFELIDINHDLPQGDDFDLIISGLTFQWVKNFNRLIGNLRFRLQSEGQLIFSTLAEGTFHLLRETFKKNNIIYPGPYLLSEIELLNYLRNNFEKIHYQQETVTEKYNSVNDFLKKIKLTGAGNPTGVPLPVTAMRKIIENYPQDDGKIKADYVLFTAILS